MLEWMISSSVLIVVICLLRFILKGKLSLRLQYALWAIVLVRLLIPFSFGHSSISVMSSVEQSTLYQTTSDAMTTVQVPSDIIRDSELTMEEAEQIGQGTLYKVEDSPAEDGRETLHTYSFQDSLKAVAGRVLRIVWLCGIAIIGLWFAGSNLILSIKLRDSRTVHFYEKCPLPVYISDAVDTPCLFGLIRPAIYLTTEAASDASVARHAIEHELTHFRHRDNLWAILRGVCLAIHWYNPFVWCAAILSRNDAELACDEATIRRLGESERAAYGKTLIGLTCKKRAALLNTATTMTGSGKIIKERIMLIAKKPHMATYTLVAVILVAVFAVGCTFTGATEPPASFDEEITAAPIPIDTVAIQSSAIPKAVIDYAADYVRQQIDHHNELGSNSSYAITDAKITGLEQINTGSAELSHGTALYRLEYRLLADHPENISLTDGMTMEDGWLTEWSSAGQPYLLLHQKEAGGETVWTRVCVTNSDVIFQDFGTLEMLTLYGNHYLAASIELYKKHMKTDEPVFTLPVLELSHEEYDAVCNGVLADLKTGWWIGGAMADCAYDAAAFECVYRQTAYHYEMFYGYAGYFRFDQDGNCVQRWYGPTIVTLDADTQQFLDIWWPGDGAYHESDILARFPYAIAKIVAEPNEKRYQIILGRLMQLAQARIP
ncbi:MAG: hypothetical protein J6B67_05110 [Oscillospiraceae bacterium]|nr:hypothetical protein [Oscillospiraceae bacterium]